MAQEAISSVEGTLAVKDARIVVRTMLLRRWKNPALRLLVRRPFLCAAASMIATVAITIALAVVVTQSTSARARKNRDREVCAAPHAAASSAFIHPLQFAALASEPTSWRRDAALLDDTGGFRVSRCDHRARDVAVALDR